MNSMTPNGLSSIPKTRGAAFITTLVFTSLLLAISAAILSWSTVESRLNKVHENRLLTRTTAEALLERAAAQAIFQVNATSDLAAGSICNPTIPGSALTVPDPSFFDGTDIDPATVEIVGRVIPSPPGSFLRVPSTDQRMVESASSIQKDQSGLFATLQIMARASTFPNHTGSRETTYLTRTYTIFDGPVIQYAAFYNTDLEVAPGPVFNIYGPVHTNASLWVTKQSNVGANAGTALTFWDTVSAVGPIRKGYLVNPIQAVGTLEQSGNDPIRFMSPSGPIDLNGQNNGYASYWCDDLMGTTSSQSSLFRAFANSTYGNPSNLQTSAHGVLRRPLPGQLDNYVADSNLTDNIIDPLYRNVPRALIERPLFTGEVEYVGPDVERQKMSRQAGLYIIANASGMDLPVVRDPNGNAIPGGLLFGEYRAYARDPASPATNPVFNPVILPGQRGYADDAGNTATPTNPAHPWIAANVANPAIPAQVPVRPVIKILPHQMTDMRRFAERSPANPTGFNHRIPRSNVNVYVPKVINLIEVDMTALKLAVNQTINNANQTMIFPYDEPENNPGADSYRSTYRAQFNEFGVTNGTREGLYTHIDQRYRIAGMNANDWDGSVYIESVNADFLNLVDPNAPAPLPAGSYPPRRAPGHRNSGVRLINGRGPIVSANASRIANTAFPCSPGLTLTTNDSLYILGHLNADGLIRVNPNPPAPGQLTNINITDDPGSGNNSSLFPDPRILVGAPREQPLALMADALTILSQPVFDAGGRQIRGWNDSLSHLITFFNPNIAGGSYAANWQTSAGFPGTPIYNNNVDGRYTAPNNPATPGADKWAFHPGATAIPGPFIPAPEVRSPMRRFLLNPNGTGQFPNPATTVGYDVPVATPDERVAIDIATPNRPPVNTKFIAGPTEISSAFIIGYTPSAKHPTNPSLNGQNSGGLHNLPRFLERWSDAAGNSVNCAIRGSMVVMFDSKVAWEPWSLRVYNPPTRLWGFHNFFRNFVFPDDIPATRSIGPTNLDLYTTLTRDEYINGRPAQPNGEPAVRGRNTLWPASSFTTPLY
jgi:hypothetical protein